MAEIRVQRADVGASKKVTKRQLYAQVCYHFPAYTLKDAQELSARDLNLLLKTAQKLDARKMSNIGRLIMAPHAKDKSAAKKLIEYFQNLAKD